MTSVASSRSKAATERGLAAGVSFERTGTGPSLLLIHGLGATKRIWRPQVERLATERDVIAVDMPGFGDSPMLAGPATPWALAEAVMAACGRLGVERPHVAGNSLGGWVALEIAKRDEAASLCLISPAGLWSKPLGPRSVNTRAVARRLRPLIGSLVRTRRSREAMLRTTVGRPERIPIPDARDMIEAWVDAPGYDAANEEMRRYIATDLDRITVPTSIVWGELDRLVRAPRPERRPPDTKFIQVPGIGHTPNWDDPELITDFLLEASSATAATPAA